MYTSLLLGGFLDFTPRSVNCHGIISGWVAGVVLLGRCYPYDSLISHH